MNANSSHQPEPSPACDTVEKTISREPLPKSHLIFFLLFFLSGMSALIYEIMWTRRLTLVFGNTVHSVSTVLVAFMGGLALGSALFGRFVDKRKDPIKVYAWLEIGIGVTAFLIPFALAGLNPAYRFIYAKIASSTISMSLIRFVLSTSILIIPTTMMGATLPVLTTFIVRKTDVSGLWIGSLYALNTLGAMTGCFLAGFLLPGWIGITLSERLAAAVNIAIGITAFWMHYKIGNAGPDTADKVRPGEPTKATSKIDYSRSTLGLVLFIFGASGMLALAYEVIWARVLVFLLGSSIYAFSMILTVYLFGLTSGSAIAARMVDKLKRPLHAFGWLEILIGISVLVGMLFFRGLPFQPYVLKLKPFDYIIRNFLSTSAVVLLPTLLMGAAFPLAVRIYTRSIGTIGRETGTLYAVNTLGAILGSFLSGFVLIPLLGSKNSMVLLIVLSIASGIFLIYLSIKEEGSPVYNLLAVLLVALPVLLLPSSNDFMERLLLKALGMERADIIAFDEDATAAVAVVGWGNKPGEESSRNQRLLSVNGHTMTYLVTETQLMAHIPIALAEAPKKVLNICFGMGTTFVSSRRAGMDVDFVELCPYVVRAFPHFQEDPSMLNEAGVGRIVADGRNYVLLSDKSYDIITIDPPPPPWSAGTVNLNTREFFELCRQRLNPGGIVCHWIPIYPEFLTVEQYKVHLRTFMEVFPHTTVWNSPNELGTYLIATPERLQIDEESFKAFFKSGTIRNDLFEYGSKIWDGERVLSLLMLDEDEAREFAVDSLPMSDDLPVVEFPLFRESSEGEIFRMDMLQSHKPE